MKRSISFALALVLALICCFGSAPATATNAIMPMSSTTLRSQLATIRAGNTAGHVNIYYSVAAKSMATELGVSSIVIYKSGGSYVTTIRGTTANGMIGSGVSHIGSYTYVGTPGQSYYAVVTFYAKIGAVSDSSTTTTSTVTAPI